MNGEAGALRLLWRSVGFRLAFYYGLLVTITMIATVSIIYLQTVVVLYQGLERQVSAERQTLVARFQEGGAAAVVQDIERALSDGQNSATEIFLYVDSRGLKLAGNLDQAPEGLVGQEQADRRMVLRDGHSVMAHVVARTMPDGSRLFVGRDFRDQEAIEARVTGGIEAAAAVAVVLLVGGLFAFRQELDRSVEAIRRTLTRVASGEIKERVVPVGREDEFALLGRDINKMLDRIELLMRGVQHVSDTIAHNLRTPLTRILARLRTAAAQADVSVTQRRMLEDAVSDIEDLTAVFEKLLQIAEAEAGARRIPFQAVAIASVASEVIDFYEAIADQQGATVEGHNSGNGIVLGDPDLLASAIANLVDNALKYGGAGARVTVESRATQDHVVLAVKDDGPGIPAHALAHLGTRFFRLDRSVGGHGLGLASVAAVVALHGGRMAFEDAAPGLLVRLEFPLHKR